MRCTFIDIIYRDMTNVQFVDVVIPRIFCETTVGVLRMNTQAYYCLQKQKSNMEASHNNKVNKNPLINIIRAFIANRPVTVAERSKA
jgi:hypothetical protein